MFIRTIPRRIAAVMLMGACGLPHLDAKPEIPVRHPVARQDRPMDNSRPRFVDAIRGSDSNPGTESAPWKSIQASLEKLEPGDTLYLSGGTYFENLYCAIAGREDAPITIRSKPGERAVIDGGFPEFQTDPASAWEPVEGGATDEYQSTREYKNIRDVVGLFGDSNIGLQTYWHREDLQAENEVSIPASSENPAPAPTYCGPGIWYNRASGRIHVRLAHTHLNHPLVRNYKGEVDPRKVPLVIAPFQSTPLKIDLATHVRFQDLVFRGGGLNNVEMRFGIGIEFDHVTIFGGTYGLRAKNSGPVRFLHSAIYGGIPPWAFYGENALQASNAIYSDPYTHGPGIENKRNIARLTSHALLVMEGFEESDVFAYPFNNRWEIAWSEFADGHDGIYPNGTNLRIHHNWIGNMQDDAVYLSSPTRKVCDDIHFFRNYITGCTSAFGFHDRGGPEGAIFVYGNVVDARFVGSGRWRTPNPDEIKPYGMNFFLVHGASRMRSIESLSFLHNTAILNANGGYAGRALSLAMKDSSRQVLNNIFVYMDKYPAVGAGESLSDDVLMGGNVHWSPTMEAPVDWLKKVREAPGSALAKEKFGLEWEAGTKTGDPLFAAFSISPDAENDYRPGEKGAAHGTALPLPGGLHLEGGVEGADAGAFQSGNDLLKVGVEGRIKAGAPAK